MISRIVNILSEAEKFVSSQSSGRSAMLAGLKSRPDGKLLRIAFMASLKNSPYGAIDSIMDALLIKKGREKIKEKVINLYLHRQFAANDPLREYTQRKWIYHKKQLKHILNKEFYKITPVTVDIVPSLECVQNCVVCSNVDWRVNIEDKGWFNKRSRERMMTRRNMFRIIDNIRKGGAKAVVFTGGGEPLTNPNTLDGIAYARKSGLEVGLYTNGILLDEGAIDSLIKSSLTFIRISLNAGSPMVHAQIGGYSISKDYYNRVISSLRLLAEKNRGSGNRCTVGIGYIVNPWNVYDIYLLAKTLKKIDADPRSSGGIAYFAVRPSIVHRNYRGGRQFGEHVFKKAHEIINRKVIPLLKNTGIKVIEVKSRFLAVHSREKPFDRCLASPMFSLVGPDGGMYLCVESYYGHKRCRFGDLTKERLDTIFRSRKHRKIVDNIDFRYCPPVCKMYELNKAFDRINKTDRKTIGYIRNWFMSKSPGRPPAHVNFL
ncbi:MAG: radical SAM protein [Candidatus Omnitrophica bacterium]|nr:radical SAM protein [Candidatus Omnitrophota bacterium]